MSNLIKNIQNISFQKNLFKKHDKIVLAISGGPDSICMLHVFLALQKKYSLQLLIAHVNYNLRGNDSQKDENLVQKLAKKYRMKIEVLTLSSSSSPEYRRGEFNLSEEKLRNIRYDFFEKVRRDNKFDSISVAHNLNDQVETFLMRIIRGSGLSGLTAMKFKNGLLIRPLLATPKKEILEYLKKNKIKFRIDKTNLENKYLRNKIRNQLIPVLEKNFNPCISETIFSSIASISEDYDYISEVSEKKARGIETLEIKKLKKLHPAILQRVLLEKIKEKRGDVKNIGVSNIEEILKIINSTKNKIQTVKFKGLKIIRRSDKLEISKL